jgi:hypothetical protein
MALVRPSVELSTKTNIKPVGNRLHEATAEDFAEIASLLNSYADAIEALQLSQSPNPFYGRYTSIALLEAAYTTGEENAWAVIDAGAGITPQIAIWDNIGLNWEISGAVSNTIEVANFAALPAPGTIDKWYVTLDTNYLYRWYNSRYNLIGVPATHEVKIQGALVDITGKTDLSVFENNDKFRYWDNERYVQGLIIDASSITLPDDLDDDTKIKIILDF